MNFNLKRLLLVVATLVFLLFCGGLVWWWTNTYEGKTPQQWFALALRDQGNLQQYAMAFRRLDKPGTSFLARELTRQPPRYLRTYDNLRLQASRFIKLPPLPLRASGPNEIECAKKLLGYLERDAAAALIRRLNQGPTASRKYVVQALGELGPAADELVGPSLARGLHDPSMEIAYESITSLGMVLYRPDEIVPLLIPLMKDPQVRVRVEASYALGSYPPKPELTLEPLVSALDDTDATVRANAARALGKLGTNALPAALKLREQLKDTVLPAARAAEALLSIDPPRKETMDEAMERALNAAEASGNDYFRLIALSSRLRRGEETEDFLETCLRQMARADAPYLRWEAVERMLASGLASEAVTNALRRGAADSNGLVRQKSRAVLKEK